MRFYFFFFCLSFNRTRITLPADECPAHRRETRKTGSDAGKRIFSFYVMDAMYFYFVCQPLLNSRQNAVERNRYFRPAQTNGCFAPRPIGCPRPSILRYERDRNRRRVYSVRPAFRVRLASRIHDVLLWTNAIRTRPVTRRKRQVRVGPLFFIVGPPRVRRDRLPRFFSASSG